VLDERIRANHSEFMALVESGGGPFARGGYTGRSDFYNVIGRSNDYTVVVRGIGTQGCVLGVTLGGGRLRANNHGRGCSSDCGQGSGIGATLG
jgi:hypothetical protein